MKRVPVLLYHAVTDTPMPGPLAPFTVGVEQFNGHLDAIVAAGFETMTVSQLASAIRDGADVPSRPVLITFDDGLADFAHSAVPALGARGMTTTTYVTTSWIDRASHWSEGNESVSVPTLTSEQIAGFDRELVEVGSHGHTHIQMDLAGPDRLTAETSGSREILRELTGEEIRSFAYPHGYYSRAAREAVTRAGYQSACGVRNRVSSTLDDCLAIARLTVTSDLTADSLMSLIEIETPAGRPTGVERTKAWGWRQVRRCRSVTNRPDVVR